MTLRIAMWSGPRNISTAMMRAWENREDCSVIDEPFYACYLTETGAQHPCREAIIASQPTVREVVVGQLNGPVEADIFYQKHMTHHMPRGCDLRWTSALCNVFLIRSPEHVIASYLQKMPTVAEADIGIVRQRELFDEITRITGTKPPVIDGRDVLDNPRGLLQQLCRTIGVAWSDNMLSWAQGSRKSDGVWASHWYQSVWASSGFEAYQSKPIELSASARALADAMQPHYEAMARHRLRAW